MNVPKLLQTSKENVDDLAAAAMARLTTLTPELLTTAPSTRCTSCTPRVGHEAQGVAGRGDGAGLRQANHTSPEERGLPRSW
jgi:hypothetical protein